MRRKIVAGNWKMNTSVSEGSDLAKNIAENWNNNGTCDLIIAPPHTHLSEINIQLVGSNIGLAAQDCSSQTSGAYTGEVAAQTIAEIGASYVIIGHSERRTYHRENEELLTQKMEESLKAGLEVIYCCGETQEEREHNIHFEIIANQIKKGLFHLNNEEIKKVVIAYEPVWAIGTGLTASSEQAQEMHAHIRNLLKEQYGDIAQEISILYGGSVKPANSSELFACEDIDGALVGGASLKADSFIAIANSF